jgi:hypothetical protein
MGLAGRAVEVARYFKYYGQLAFQTELPFVLETVAHDLCALNELAFDLSSGAREELLRIFLQVDKEGEGATREASLKGVRKAQVKLATYYLLHGDEAAAREVFRRHALREPGAPREHSRRDPRGHLAGVLGDHRPGTNFDFIPGCGRRRKRRQLTRELIPLGRWHRDSCRRSRAPRS